MCTCQTALLASGSFGLSQVVVAGSFCHTCDCSSWFHFISKVTEGQNIQLGCMRGGKVEKEKKSLQMGPSQSELCVNYMVCDWFSFVSQGLDKTFEASVSQLLYFI